MDIFIAIVAILLGIVGLVGSVLPVIPGPPISWLGILVLFIWGSGTNAGEPMSLAFLLIMLGITIVVTVVDYIVPSLITKKTGGSKCGSWGAIVGLFVGIIFFPPWGMIFGSALGAFLFELLFAKKKAGASFKSALGAFLGFLTGTGIKLAASSVMMYYIVVYGF